MFFYSKIEQGLNENLRLFLFAFILYSELEDPRDIHYLWTNPFKKEKKTFNCDNIICTKIFGKRKTKNESEKYQK
jgi:hypothetical protein